MPTYSSAPTIFFITGVQRSGTTLLSFMLRNHSAIHLEDYSLAFRIIHALKTVFGRVLPHRLQMSEREILARLVEVDYKGRLADLLAEVEVTEAASVQSLLTEAVKVKLRSNGKQCWGDKSPNLQAYYSEILTLLPQARFVHVVRDGRATASSMYRRAHKDLRWSAQQWVDGNMHALQYQVLLGKERLLLVRYEDLLTNTEQTMRTICDFLELAFDPAILSPANSKEQETSTAYVAPRLEAEKIDAYRSTISEQQLRQIERIQGPLLQRLGYPLHSDLAATDFRPLSTAQQLYLHTKTNFRALFRAKEVRLENWQAQEVAVPFRKRLGFFLRMLGRDLFSHKLFLSIFDKKQQQLP